MRHSEPRSDTANAAPANPVPRVVVASPVVLYREGLAASLARDGRLAVIAKAATADVLAAVAAHQPDAVLVDASSDDGLAVVRALHAADPATRIIGFGISGGSCSLLACAEAGCCAFVDSDGTIADLVDAVLGALRGELRCTPRLAAMLCDRLSQRVGDRPAATASLTAREREVAALVVEGRSNKEIAIDLSIGPATVKNHVHNILDKLHVARRAAIARGLGAQTGQRAAVS